MSDIFIIWLSGVFVGFMAGTFAWGIINSKLPPHYNPQEETKEVDK